MSEASSIRVYVTLPEPDAIEALADDLCTWLVERGFNQNDEVEVALAVFADTGDVRAWASDPEEWVSAIREAAQVYFPQPDSQPSARSVSVQEGETE